MVADRRETMNCTDKIVDFPGRNYPGRGIVKCLVCGKPVATHRLGPCPEIPAGEPLRVSATQIQGTKKEDQ